MGSAPIEHHRLVGAWRLASASSTTSDGERDDTPYGVNPTGLLTYSEDGRVTAIMSYGGRKPLSVVASVSEQAEAFKTFLAYTGRYSFTGEDITHRIEISSIQNYVSRDLIRSVKFEADRMILTTPPTPVNGKIRTLELVWQRVPGTP